MNPTLTIVCVATGRYLEFWVDLVTSLGPGAREVKWLLFTDRESEIPESTTRELGYGLRVVFQKHLAWPQPTLLRYRWIASQFNFLESDYVMYLDADMLFIRPLILNEIFQEMTDANFVTVSHPGYFRPKNRMRFYLLHPEFFAKDFLLILKEGGLGAWEKNKKSKAFVPFYKRRQYVCGGCWFGKKDSFIHFVTKLDSMVSEDLQNRVTARFHDESHLNALVSISPEIKVASPKFCFDRSYPQLEDIHGLILAVDKNSENQWRR